MTIALSRGRKALVLSLALVSPFLAVPALALEAKEGLVKIAVDETNARVSIFRLVDIAKGKYESFLYDQDPRTTYVTLSFDGKHAKLGDASDYRFNVLRTETGVTIEFRSSFCAVREMVEFAKSEGSALADGVRLSFELENVSEKDATLGLRMLVDTYLGEKAGLHFASDKNPKIVNETEITRDSGEAWLSTTGEKGGFMIQLEGAGIDRPDRILVANWKRLADSTWGFDPNPQRNFTLIPYSINDSAAALYWEPTSVPRGGIRRLSFAMGAFNEKGYAAQSARSTTEQIFEAAVLGQAQGDKASALAIDLVAVRDLITRIDQAIASGNADPQEIAAWKKILDRLEERKKDY